MEDKNIVMARLIAEKVCAHGGKVYYVGGYVRDCLCGIQSKDVDIEVHGISPQKLSEILESIGKPKAMGASFGIFGLAGYELDISLPRKKNDSGRGKSDFTEYADPFVGAESAAKRRDFTVNALMQDVLTGEVYDFFGGRRDLENGILRHVDDITFSEDPLRVIRAAQLAARFGFSVSDETIKLCKSLDLSQLSCERVREELKKVLVKSEKPSVFFKTLQKMDALDVWFPEVGALIGVKQPAQFHPEGDVWNHTMLVLDIGAALRDKAKNPEGFMMSLLCHDFGKTVTTTDDNGRIRSIGHEMAGVDIARRFVKRLTSDINLCRYIENMVELHMRPNIIAERSSSAKAFCKLFDASCNAEDLLLVSEADFLGCAKDESYVERKEYLYKMLKLFRERMKKPYVTGADLIKAGYAPGKAMGEALKHAHKLRLAGLCKKEALCQTIAFLKHMAKEETK